MARFDHNTYRSLNASINGVQNQPAALDEMAQTPARAKEMGKRIAAERDPKKKAYLKQWDAGEKVSNRTYGTKGRIIKAHRPGSHQEAVEYAEFLEGILENLCEELGLDPQALMEDVFDSPASAAASRANVKRVKKALGARSPHTKAVTKLHGAMKKSRYYYGISDSELDRRAGDEYDDFGRPSKKPKLTPMSGKSFDGYDASFGGKKKGVNLGAIKKASSAIKKTELARKKAKKPV